MSSTSRYNYDQTDQKQQNKERGMRPSNSARAPKKCPVSKEKKKEKEPEIVKLLTQLDLCDLFFHRSSNSCRGRYPPSE